MGFPPLHVFIFWQQKDIKLTEKPDTDPLKKTVLSVLPKIRIYKNRFSFTFIFESDASPMQVCENASGQAHPRVSPREVPPKSPGLGSLGSERSWEDPSSNFLRGNRLSAPTDSSVWAWRHEHRLDG